jgi:hypothetical protein
MPAPVREPVGQTLSAGSNQALANRTRMIGARMYSLKFEMYNCLNGDGSRLVAVLFGGMQERKEGLHLMIP